MDDAERGFWAALEYRICREVEGFQDPQLRWMWCDGLDPQVYDLHGDPPCIRGVAYFGPSGQERWQFTLLIGDALGAAGTIDWTSLLPADDTTGWLSPRIDERRLVLDPAGATREP
ncbi:hypothetical protein AB0B66_28765 [Catellatospora sp. NPDC049111]|uniref:hypothetical protein n=1 Tax=Catellatospora sp. NPDC049111 TaxID=3155271 RepID=UPI0033D54DB3